MQSLAQYFYKVKNGSSNIVSKSSSKNLSNGEVFTENWHFYSSFVFKTTKTSLFVFITEILWWTFWRNNWWSVFDVVKRVRLISYLVRSCGSLSQRSNFRWSSFFNTARCFRMSAETASELLFSTILVEGGKRTVCEFCGCCGRCWWWLDVAENIYMIINKGD